MLPRRAALIRLAVLPLCFVSGAAGLTYEVIWHRLLAVVLGNASFATAAALAAVMGGMGAGALAMGRRADRRDPLILYGGLELALGASALAIPWLSTQAASWARPLLAAVGPGWISFGVRFLVAAAVVLVPAFLLGATLPALARAVADRERGSDRVGRAVGAVYALNTAGAALGCAVTGYLLLGAWGLRATNHLAAALDLGAGALALLLALLARRIERAAKEREAAPEEGAKEEAQEEAQEEAPIGALPPRLVLGLAFASGFVVLGLETVWTRLFLLLFGHDVYAFTAMLVCVLVGLAVGAALYRALPERARRSERLLEALFAGLGVLALLSLAFVGRRYLAVGLDLFGIEGALSIPRSHERGMALQLVLAAATILPAAAAAGALFPALVARYRAADARSGDAEGQLLSAGARTGRVLAANTLGTLLGPLVTPLILVPWLGIAGAAYALVLLALAASLSLIARSVFLRAEGRRWRGAILVAVAGAGALFAVPADLPRRVLHEKIGPRHTSFLLYTEGRSATVAVTRNAIHGERQIFVNGINEVTTRLVHDQSFALLGHLGMLLHPDPREVGVICLGGGLAAGAVTRHARAERITIVDLEPSVEHAARAFADLNFHALDDPRVSLVIDDGRSHLATTEARYDVIVLDSTHPRAVDSWLLYTREFYRAARGALAEEGVLVEWLPLHGLTADEFRIIVGTFLASFPGATLWTNAGFEPYGQTAYALLVASRGRLTIDPARIAARIEEPSVRAALSPWGLASPAEILECLYAGPEALGRWTRGLPRNTDDRPITQFVTEHTDGAPMTPSRLLEVFAPSAELLEGLEGRPDAALGEELARRWEAQGLLLHGSLLRAAEVCADCAKFPMYLAAMREGRPYYEALARRYRGEPRRTRIAAAGLALHHREAQALGLLEGLVAEGGPSHEDPEVHLELGLLQARGGAPEAAAESFRRALALDPDHALARVGLGRALLAGGEVDPAILTLERAVEEAPALAEAHEALGAALMQAGPERPDGGARAEAELREALRLDRRALGARVSLGRLYLRQRRDPEAAATFAAGLRFHPYDTDLLFNLALAEQRRGRLPAARRRLRRALFLDPTDQEAREALEALE